MMISNFIFRNSKIRSEDRPDKIKLNDEYDRSNKFIDWYGKVSVKCKPDEKMVSCQCIGR